MTHLSSPAAQAPDAYVGRHRSHTRTARPLPMTVLDGGGNTVAVGVNLTTADPYVIVTSDWDQAVITLTSTQRARILRSAQAAVERRAIEADLAREDAFWRTQVRS